jgi:hypothetical protein
LETQVRGDVALDGAHRGEVVEGERDLPRHVAVDRQRPRVDVHRGQGQPGVDPVELAGRRPQRADAGVRPLEALGERGRGVGGSGQGDVGATEAVRRHPSAERSQGHHGCRDPACRQYDAAPGRAAGGLVRRPGVDALEPPQGGGARGRGDGGGHHVQGSGAGSQGGEHTGDPREPDEDEQASGRATLRDDARHGGEQEHAGGHRADQHGLVGRAELPDRQLLDRRRRQVDHRRPDGQHR